MNRIQAEHILDAYVRMRMLDGDKDAVDSLRDLYECSREPKCCNCACFLGDDAECSMGFRKRMEKLGIEVDK